MCRIWGKCTWRASLRSLILRFLHWEAFSRLHPTPHSEMLMRFRGVIGGGANSCWETLWVSPCAEHIMVLLLIIPQGPRSCRGFNSGSTFLTVITATKMQSPGKNWFKQQKQNLRLNIFSFLFIQPTGVFGGCSRIQEYNSLYLNFQTFFRL